MADAVQERIEREQRFASDVSHELRSPITALTAAVEVLDARRDDLPDRSQQALDVVVSQVRRFDAMVIDLLELSRIDAGATDLNPEVVDLVDLCDRVSQRYGYGDLPIEVHRRAKREALVDRVRFERILGNLLENATTHGGGPTRITIEPSPVKRSVLMAVEDCGSRRRRQRAQPDLRALRTRQRRPPPDRHRARPGARRRARHRPRRRGVGRGPPRRRRPLRRPSADGGRMMSPSDRRAACWRCSRSSTALGACSLPADEGVTPIDADGLPPEIANTTTTSTTTTTTTTPPATDERAAGDHGADDAAATTDRRLRRRRRQPVDIYYADRATDGMQRLQRQLLEPLSLQSVISQLEQPPDDLASYGVRTALEPDLIGATILERWVLTVSLNGSRVREPMNEDQKRLAIAQMVLTFTSFTVPGEGNIGRWSFQVDGTPIPVFIPDGTTRRPWHAGRLRRLRVDRWSAPPGRTTTSAPPETTGSADADDRAAEPGPTSVAEALDAVGAALPVLVDPHAQLEEGAGRELLAHPCADLLQHRAALADHHPLLALCARR